MALWESLAPRPADSESAAALVQQFEPGVVEQSRVATTDAGRCHQTGNGHPGSQFGIVQFLRITDVVRGLSLGRAF